MNRFVKKLSLSILTAATSVFLALALIFGLPAPTRASAEGGVPASIYLDTNEAYAAFSTAVNGGETTYDGKTISTAKVVLSEDLDFTGGTFTALGTEEHPYTGTFSIVSGVKITVPDGTANIFGATANAAIMGLEVSGKVANVIGTVAGDTVLELSGTISASGGLIGTVKSGATVTVENTNAVITAEGFAATVEDGATVAIGQFNVITTQQPIPSAFFAVEQPCGVDYTVSTDGVYTYKYVNGVAKAVSTGTVYATVSEALAAADGSSVKLLNNVTEDVTVPEGVTVTLDLDGYTLTNAGGHTITNNGTLTITGKGTVDNVTHARGALVNYGTANLNGATFTRSKEAGTASGGNGNSWYTLYNEGTMTIDGATVTTRLQDENGAAVGGFSSLIANNISCTADPVRTLTIKSGSFSGGINTVKNDEAGVLNISGGTFTNTTQAVVLNWSEAYISGGTFEAGENLDAVSTGKWNASTPSKTVVSKITGGEFKGAISVTGGQGGYFESDLKMNSISGGTFSILPDYTYFAEGFSAKANEAGVYVTEEKPWLAAIGKVGYQTLAEAIAAAAKNETITLLANVTVTAQITISKPITLDLNGNTIDFDLPVLNAAGTDSYAAFKVTASGKTTVYNGTVQGTGIAFYVSGGSGMAGSKCLVLGSTEEGKNLNVVTTSADDSDTAVFIVGAYGLETYANLTSHGITVMSNGTKGGTIINVKGGTIKSDSWAMYLPQTSGTTTISDGVIEGGTAIEVRNSTLNITGGVIRSVLPEGEQFETAPNGGGTTVWGAAIAISKYKNTTYTNTSKLAVNISGGEIEGEYALYEANLNADNAEINTSNLTIALKGGAFSGQVYSENKTGFLTGGTYTVAPAAEYLAEGFVLPTEKNADGVYEILSDEAAAEQGYVAKVGVTPYKTLQEAILAAEDGETVTMINDIAFTTYVNISKTMGTKVLNALTLDMNGHTLTLAHGGAPFALRIDGWNNNNTSDSTGLTLTVKNGKITGSAGTQTNAACLIQSVNQARLIAEDVEIEYNAAFSPAVALELGGTYTDLFTDPSNPIVYSHELTRVKITATYAGGVHVQGPAILRDCEFTVVKGSQNGYIYSPVAVSHNGRVTVESGTYTSDAYGAYIWATGGSLTVNGGTFTAGEGYAVLKAGDDDSYSFAVTVTDGTFNGGLSFSDNTKVAISGGTFTVLPAYEYFAEGYVAVDNGDGTYGVSDTQAARIGALGYATLQEAINAAQEGETIVLLQSVEESVTVAEGQVVTLDLNGNTLTGGENGGHTITNYGTLTVTGNGTVNSSAASSAAIYNEGTVTLEGGAYTKTENSYYVLENKGAMNVTGEVAVSTEVAGASLILNGWNSALDKPEGATATLTIEGGSFRGGLNNVKNETGGELTISGGTFTVEGADTQQYANVMNYGSATITGGEFVNTSTSTTANVANILNLYNTDAQTKAELTVTNGTFTSAKYGILNSGADVTVEGGSFTAGAYALNAQKNTSAQGSVTIKGGSLKGTSGGVSVLTNNTLAVSGGEIEGGNYGLSVSTGSATTVSGATITATNTSGVAVSVSSVGTQVTLTDVTATGATAIRVSGREITTTVESGTYSGKLNISITDGAFAITGGTFDNVAISQSKGLAIQGGEFDADVGAYLADGFVQYEQNAEGYYTIYDRDTAIADGYVAVLNGTGYKTLESAISAAAEGETVTLITHLTLNKCVNITKSVTLDLGGYNVTLTGIVDDDNVFWIYGDDSVIVIKNGAIVSSETYCDLIGVAGGSLTVENVIFERADDSDYVLSGAAIYVYGGSLTVADEIKSVNLYATVYALVSEEVTVVVNGDIESDENGSDNYTYAVKLALPEAYDEDLDDWYTNGEVNENASVSITGGVITGALGNRTLEGETVMKGVVSGGTFPYYALNDDDLAEGYVQISKTGEVISQEEAELTYQAAIGNRVYETLVQAIELANSNGNQTVVLLQDIELEEGFTVTNEVALDLNGHVLTVTLSNPNTAAVYVQGADALFTLTDSSEGAEGKLVSTGNGVYALEGGTVTVQNGAIEAFYAALSSNNTTGVGNFAIKGGTVTAQYGPAVYMPAQGTLTITDGTVNGGIIARMGTIEISGGTIVAPTENLDSIYEYYDYSGNAWLGGALTLLVGTYPFEDGNEFNVNISGGTFVNEYTGEDDQFANAVTVYVHGNTAQKVAVTVNEEETTFTVANGKKVVFTDVAELIGEDYNSAYNAYTAENRVGVTYNGEQLPVLGGTTYYATLQEAITAAGTEETTIVLLSNITENGNVKVEAGQTIVLDLNGKTLKLDPDGTSTLILNYGTLTVTDSAEGNGLDAGNSFGIANYQTGKLTLENVTVVGNIPVTSSGEVTINGATLTSNHQYPTALMVTDGSALIKDGTFTGTVYGTDKVTVAGGTFSVLPSGATVAEGILFYQNADGTYVAKSADEAVAKIGDMGYLSLQAAITAAGTDEKEVVLLQSVTESVTVAADQVITLDLNGNTLTGCGANKAAILNNGSLKIVDNNETANGTITRETDTHWYVIVNLGTMEISDVIVKNDNVEDPSSLITNNEFSSSADAEAAAATLTIHSGTFYSAYSNAVKNNEFGVIVIENGTFESGSQFINDQEQTNATVINWGSAEIKGGEFKGYYYAVSVCTYGGFTSSLKITGGTFKTSETGKGSLLIEGRYGSSYGNVAVDISGGFFENAVKSTAGSTNSYHTVEIAISDGNFKVIPDYSLFADGRVATTTPNEDGYYTVTDGTYVATRYIDGAYVGYTSLQAAIDAAPEWVRYKEDGTVNTGTGTSITLVKSTTESIVIPENKSILLTINGGVTLTNEEGKHTITVYGNLSLSGKTVDTDIVDNVSHQKAVVVNYGYTALKLNIGITRSAENGSTNSYYVVKNYGVMTISDKSTTIWVDGDYSSLIANGYFNATDYNNNYSKVTTEGKANKLTISGGIFSGGKYTVKNDDYGVMEIKNDLTNVPTFKNFQQYVVLNWNELTISGGSFEGTDAQGAVLTGQDSSNAYGGEVANNGKTTITGGTFYGAIAEYVGEVSYEISGGMFDEIPNYEYFAEGYVHSDAEGGMYGVKEGEYAAAIGTVGYESLASALEAAGTTVTTITLLRDVTESITVAQGQTIILQLNGYTLTDNGDHTITNYGTFTVKGEGTVDNVTHGKAAIFNYGTVNLLGGTYTRSEAAAGVNSYYVLKNLGSMTIYAGVTATVAGGSSALIANGYYDDAERAAEADKVTFNDDPTLSIKGGTFYSVTQEGNTVGITVKNDSGTLTISGGSFESDGVVVLNGDEAYINGGEFESSLAADEALGVIDAEAGTLTVNGGTFTSTSGIQNNIVYVANGASVKVDNGTFNNTGSGSTTAFSVNGGTLSVLSADVAVNGMLISATNKATVVVGTAGGEYTTTGNNIAVAVLIENSDLTVGGGTFTAFASYLFNIYNNSTATINGGTFVGGTEATVRLYNGAATITGGTFGGGLTEYTQNAVNVYSVKGGTFAEAIEPAYLASGYLISATTDASGNPVYKVIAESQATAKVGAYGYATLQEAINAAGENETVVLLQNVEEDITVAAEKNITLDLNGNTLTNKSSHTIVNYGVLTVTNGTVDNVTHAKAAVYNYGTVTLDGGSYTRSAEAGTATGSGGNSYYVLKNFGEMTLTNSAYVYLNGGYSSAIANGYQNAAEYTANHGSVTADNEATLTIEEGVVGGGKYAIKNDDYGTMTIKGGKFYGATEYALLNWNYLTVEGGDFDGTNGVGAVLTGYGDTVKNNGNTVIKGGTFTGEVEAYQGNENVTYAISGGMFTNADLQQEFIAEDSLMFQFDDGTYTVAAEEEAVAKVGKYGFSSLQDAIDAAQSGDKVELLKDDYAGSITVAEDKEITIDLGSYTLNAKVEITAGSVTLQNGTIESSQSGSSIQGQSVLFVRGGTVTLNGVTVRNTSTDTINSMAIGVAFAELTIEDATVSSNGYGIGVASEANVTINNATVQTYGNPISTAATHEPATLTINGGIFECLTDNGAWDYVAIYWANHGTLTISGGEFRSATAAAAGLYVKNGTVTVNGGTFTGVHNDGIKITSEESNSTEINVTITGGEFSGNRSGIYVKSTSSGAATAENYVVTVTGGKFSGGQCALYTSVAGVVPQFTVKNGESSIPEFIGTLSTDLEGFLQGGTFTEEVNEKFVAEGFLLYAPAENGGTVYTVDPEENATAKVGNKGYMTLQAAINAAGENETVVLLTDVEEDITVAAGKNITLDLNGNTLTNKSGHTITNYGVLTVTDGSEGGTGTVDNVTHAKGALVNYGTAYLNGGTFTRSQEAGYDANHNGGNSWYTLRNEGKMTINGATVTTRLEDENGTAVGRFSSLIGNNISCNTPGATLTILSGTFSGGINTVKNDEAGNLYIEGGIFTNVTQAAIMNWSYAVITGGEFRAEGFDAVETGKWNAATPSDKVLTEITGGTFYGAISVIYGQGGTYFEPDLVMNAIAGGTFIGAGETIESVKLQKGYVAYYTTDKTVLTVVADNAIPSDAVLVAGISDNSFAAYTIDPAYIAVEENGYFIIVTSEGYSDRMKAALEAYMNELLASYLYSENGEATLAGILERACATIDEFAATDDFAGIDKTVRTAKLEMNGVLTVNEENASLADAKADAKADIRLYAAILGVELPADIFEGIESAANVSAVKEAKLVAMDALDKVLADKNAELADAKADAIEAIEAAAAATEDSAAVVVPTATYLAINSAATLEEVAFYKANALAEIDDIRTFRASLNELIGGQAQDTLNAIQALQNALLGYTDEDGTDVAGKLAELQAYLEDKIKNAVTTVNSATSTEIEALYGDLQDDLNTAVEAIKDYIDGAVITLTGRFDAVDSAIEAVQDVVDANSDALTELKTKLAAAQTAIDNANAALETLQDTIDTDVLDAIAAAQQAVKDAESAILEELGKVKEDLDAELAKIIDAFAITEVLDDDGNGTGEYVSNKIEAAQAAIDKANNALTALDGRITNEVLVEIKAAQTAIANAESAILDELGKVKEGLKAELAKIIDAFGIIEATDDDGNGTGEYVSNKIEAAQAAIDKANNALTALDGKIDSKATEIISAAQQAVKEAKEAILDELGTVKSGLEEKLDQIIKAFDIVAVTDDDDNVTGYISNKIEAAQAAIGEANNALTALDGRITNDVLKAITDAQTAVTDAIAELKSYLDEKIEGLGAELDQIIKAFDIVAVTDDDDNVTGYVSNKIKDAQAAIDEANNALTDLDGKIDTTAADIVQKAQTAVTNAVAELKSYLDEKIEGLDGKIDTLQATVNAIKTTLGDENSGLVKAVADAKAAVDSAKSSLESKIDEESAAIITAAQDAVSKAVTDLQTYINEKIEGLDGKIDTLQTTVNEIKTTLGDETGGLVKAVADAKAAVDSAKISLEGKIDTTAADIVQKAQAAVTNAVTELKSYIDTAVAGVNAKVEALTGKVETYAAKLDDVAATLVTLGQTQATIVSSLEALDGAREEDVAAILAKIAEAAAKLDSIGASVGVIETTETAKTQAKADIESWINAYLDSLIGATASVGGVKALAVADTSSDLYGKLTQVFSEKNAQLVLKYYNEAVVAIDAATTSDEISNAVSTFKTQVAMVEVVEGIEAPDNSGLYALLIVIAIIAVAIIVLLIVLLIKKNNQPAPEAAAEAPAPQPVAQDSAAEAAEPVEETAESAEEPSAEEAAEPEEAPVEEPEEETEEPAEEPAEEAEEAEELAEEAIADDDDGEGVLLAEMTADGVWLESEKVRYNKSLTAKLIQADPLVHDWYGEIKNELLSYRKVRDRMSWRRENFNYRRSCVARIMIKGKTLCLFLALDPEQFAESKYKVVAVKSRGDKKPQTPCMYKLKNARRVKYAKELIAQMMAELGTEQIEREPVDYNWAYEETQALIDKGLIKCTYPAAKTVNAGGETVQTDEAAGKETAEAEVAATDDKA